MKKMEAGMLAVKSQIRAYQLGSEVRCTMDIR